MAKPALMIQGTGSDVGKSLLVAGLCRAFTRRGLTVRPFKPQNMSNNAAVTPDGGEIGRAQALQAKACGVEPSRHMNPVLLKPQTDVGAQVVVQGGVHGNAKAADYHALKPKLMSAVLDSFTQLEAEADLVLVEGAGSPAEINLREGDIANMGFALAAEVPVVLVADVERGGVIAALVGTQALLTDDESVLVKGFIINKFRGDIKLFDSATAAIVERTGWPSLGTAPWFGAARTLPQEDGMALARPTVERDAPIRIAIPRTPRIANFDDFDPLSGEADVALTYVEPGDPLPLCDLVILAGSKATLSDLRFIKDQGWDGDIKAHLRRGGRVLGVCAGYQMLGTLVKDPDGTEGAPGEEAGLGLLNVETVMAQSKRLENVEFSALGETCTGYEMHMGRTEGPDTPWLEPKSAASADGLVRGSYLHGLFAADDFRHAFLKELRPEREQGTSYEAGVEATLDALADHLEAHLDLDALLVIAERRARTKSNTLPSQDV